MEGGLDGPLNNVFECNQFGFETLILSENKFSGTIPTSLEKLTTLKRLDLGYNLLTGTIPESLGNFTNSRKFELSGNQLISSIPKSFENLMALRKLDLSSNLLNGVISSSLGRLSNLEILRVRAECDPGNERSLPRVYNENEMCSQHGSLEQSTSWQITLMPTLIASLRNILFENTPTHTLGVDSATLSSLSILLKSFA
ncbi:hypothetical protein L6452_20212 [Arctium lappa]|uniref:Uncharacterized protein n=1 Tax=Arctium lappa TaxID=4217 RepID=A0ACB9BAS9_ARCLA|nr:hypothetical protein L6452_20212 [Arctium lappa]